ncbi:uncharacterized protein LOC128389828 isoform X2 [Panonychus citri]|uniref:uncharacterized protein LOC128389828 isoform X2 n=1 Tax=Panonychus citri TaxID=50023 RepID=UPI0023073293|nr:uncharacterized protein LOC128389828 isoform X2 [Panonychus citri]
MKLMCINQRSRKHRTLIVIISRIEMELKKVNHKNGQNSYPSLRRYLNKQMLDINYLTREEPNVQWPKWWFYVAFFLCLLNVAKLAYQLFQSKVTNISYYIGDLTLVAGSSRKPLTLLYLSWYVGTLNCCWILLRSHFQPKLKKWINFGELLEHLDSTIIHPYTGIQTRYHRLFFRANDLYFYSGGVGAFFLTIPSFFIYPKQFIHYLVIWLTITVSHFVLIFSYAANFGVLFAFQAYYYGKQMIDEKNGLIDNLGAKKVCINREMITLIINSSIKTSLVRLIGFIEGYRFWALLLETVFLATFIAQSIVLYMAFFVDIPTFLRIALVILAITNWICGLSLPFFFGSFSNQSIQKYCMELLKVLYNNTSNQVKIKIINYLEHVEERQFFVLFGALNFSMFHFLMVLLEMSANLLLLIANLRRSSN